MNKNNLYAKLFEIEVRTEEDIRIYRIDHIQYVEKITIDHLTNKIILHSSGNITTPIPLDDNDKNIQ